MRVSSAGHVETFLDVDLLLELSLHHHHLVNAIPWRMLRTKVAEEGITNGKGRVRCRRLRVGNLGGSIK